VAEVARIPEIALTAMLGRASGHHLYALAHNRDPRRVQGGRRRRSIGSQRALGRSNPSLAELDTTLVSLVDRVTRRLRDADRVGRTVVLRLRFTDFERVTRSHTLAEPTSHTDTLLAALRSLLHAAAPMIRERGITLIGVAIANLDDDDAVQLELPFGRRSGSALDDVLDDVRQRFGGDALGRAVMLGRTQGFSMPTLPD
jgi:DNA polymerase-4